MDRVYMDGWTRRDGWLKISRTAMHHFYLGVTGSTACRRFVLREGERHFLGQARDIENPPGLDVLTCQDCLRYCKKRLQLELGCRDEEELEHELKAWKQEVGAPA